tara:strand:+ start:2515 stop:3090 length:576 start_codon:yes stop_codon:yes gene_type:complete
MDSLMKDQYKYINNFLSEDLVAYLSFFILNQDKFIGDDQIPQSHSLHSNQSPIMYNLLHFLRPRMEKETGLKLKPIYSYTRLYLPGADLYRHKDRGQCEISASLTLQYHYEEKNYKWPLCMGDTPIIINSGDGVIYKGCEIEHWRPVFIQEPPSWHHQIFIHYVDLNGENKNLEEEYSSTGDEIYVKPKNN